MKKLERKPLSFSTTMRNPERIASFVNSLVSYEGEILTNEIIRKVVLDWIVNKLIRTDTANKDFPEYKKIYQNTETTFTVEQSEFIYEYIENNTKGHKDAGFDKGWPTRFNTYMLLPMEFGFVFYKIGEPIEISETGKLLISARQNEIEPNEMNESIIKISDIFLNALVKYQTNNPFRRNLIKNAPFVLYLKTVRELSQNFSWEKTGIYRSEIPFVTCWPNSDEKELANYIHQFRSEYGKRPSDEIVYEHCLNLLESDNRKRFKMKHIVKEGVDDFIRKLRITGVVSLRGNGRLIDINSFEKDRLDYIISDYASYSSFDETKKYYQYMGEIDNILVETHTVISREDLHDVRQNNLISWATEMKLGDLEKELKSLTNINGSQHPVLKYINPPTRFEFLMSVALKHKYPNLDVIPNYPVDDEGMPTSTARGGVGDIEVYGQTEDVLVEVTMMKNKSQSTNEIPGITRHMIEFRNKKLKTVFSLFVAPSIHPDTSYMIGFSKHQSDVDIYAFTLDEFIERWKSSNEIKELAVVQ